jgi:hypothetical protein
MDTLRIYSYKTFTGRGVICVVVSARPKMPDQTRILLIVLLCGVETSTILPAVSTIERLCADALVAAERQIETRIAENLTADVRDPGQTSE